MIQNQAAARGCQITANLGRSRQTHACGNQNSHKSATTIWSHSSSQPTAAGRTGGTCDKTGPLRPSAVEHILTNERLSLSTRFDMHPTLYVSRCITYGMSLGAGRRGAAAAATSGANKALKSRWGGLRGAHNKTDQPSDYPAPGHGQPLQTDNQVARTPIYHHEPPPPPATHLQRRVARTPL
jgi:hypothetical protein